MPRPRSPKIGVAIPLTLLSSLYLTDASAQWQDGVGYDALVAELGGPPPTQLTGTTFIPANDSGWRYRKGTSEASSPTDAWRFPAFVEDGSWTTGQTPIGYGDGDDNTVLSDMRGILNPGYTSVYLRRAFTIAPGGVPSRLKLGVYVDDGAVVWINGTEVARLHVSGGFLAFADTASNHEAEWENIVIEDAHTFLVEGSNVVAIHALNQSITSSDFSIDAELSSPALRVSQVEGASGTNFLPDTWSGGGTPSVGDSYPGTGALVGTDIFVQSVSGSLTYNASVHAVTVAGTYMYGTGTLSEDLGEVDAYYAGGWLNADSMRAGTSSAPKVEANPLQNHSWISNPSEGTTAAELNEVVRRIDYAIGRDRFLCVAGINNGNTTVPPVLATAYNVLSVGRSNGGHSRGGTLADYDGPGRLKPEIVAPGTQTSWATGMVSSAGTLLLGVIRHEGLNKAREPDVLKAILMAGATKTDINNWDRTTTRPLDTRLGAGELNVQNSYHILLGGEATPAMTAGAYGWHDGSLAGPGSDVLSFEVSDDIGEFSAILTWDRTIDTATWLGDALFSDTLADMSLELHRTDGASPELCDSSFATIGNVEHVYLRGLPHGSYTLTVTSDIAAEYAIAWRADPGPLPAFTMSPGASPDELMFDFTGLAEDKSYTLQRSTDLETWTTETTINATGPTASHTDTDGLSVIRHFYRLIWDPAN